MSLKDRYGPTALVTGASSGIGMAFARLLYADGFRVILVARRESVLTAFASELNTNPGASTRVIAADLGRPDEITKVLQLIDAEQVGLFVSAAGFGSSGPFEQLDVESEADMVRVNCEATVRLVHGVGTAMLARKRGAIFLFGSLLGFQGVPGSATYSATKAFNQSFAEALHSEWKSRGIDVISCAPGPVLTGFDARADMTIARGDTPERVARESLSAIGKRATVVPGRMSKMLNSSLLPFPRRLRIAILRRFMNGLSNHGKQRPTS